MARGNFRTNPSHGCLFCGARGDLVKRGQKYQPMYLCQACAKKHDEAKK